MNMTRSEWLKRERVETDKLKREALELGIEIPYHKSWWWDDFDRYVDDYNSLEMWEYVSDEYTYLTDIGKAGVRKLIYDEKFNRRERWVKLITQIIVALTGLGGIIIGIISSLKK